MKTKTRSIISIFLFLAMLGTSYISNAPVAKATPPAMLAMVQVISPNGGETYSAGQDMEISFVNPMSTLTGIRIKNSNGYYYDLEWTGILNGNKWEENTYPSNSVQKKIWNIPADVVPGQYKVEIKAIDPVFANNTAEVIIGGDSSDNYFSIIGRTTSKIKVISPNGGERWQIGNEYIIKWNASDRISSRIDLYKGGRFVKNLLDLNDLARAEIKPGMAYSMVWTPDISLIPGDDYKIRVSDTYRDQNIYFNDIWKMPNYDESDNYFSIVKIITPPYCYFDRISIPEGAIIQANGEADVYIIKYAEGKAFKRLILNPFVFRSYGHLKWGNIIRVDKCVLDSFITSNLVRSSRNGKIYSLSPNGDTGVRIIVKNQAVLQKLGLDPVSAYEINETDVNSYVGGQDLN